MEEEMRMMKSIEREVSLVGGSRLEEDEKGAKRIYKSAPISPFFCSKLLNN